MWSLPNPAALYRYALAQGTAWRLVSDAWIPQMSNDVRHVSGITYFGPYTPAVYAPAIEISYKGAHPSGTPFVCRISWEVGYAHHIPRPKN